MPPYSDAFLSKICSVSVIIYELKTKQKAEKQSIYSIFQLSQRNIQIVNLLGMLDKKIFLTFTN